MNCYFYLEKHADTLIEKTNIRPQETLEFKINKQMQTFSFFPPKKISELGKWLLAVTSFEATNSVLNVTHENYSFSVTVSGH